MKAACKRGHPFVDGSFWWDKNGHRHCKQCWRAVSAQRRRAAGVPSLAEKREVMRERAIRWLGLMHTRGMTCAEIAVEAGVSAKRVREVIAKFFPGDKKKQAQRIIGDRAWWTLPGEELSQIAAQIRSEIAVAEGFARPMP